jgi:hypothetical protein
MRAIYEDLGATVIDATRPLAEVVAAVIAAATRSGPDGVVRRPAR